MGKIINLDIVFIIRKNALAWRRWRLSRNSETESVQRDAGASQGFVMNRAGDVYSNIWTFFFPTVFNTEASRVRSASLSWNPH